MLGALPLTLAHKLPLGRTLILMPSAPALTFVSKNRGVYQSGPQLRYISVRHHRDDHPIRILRNKTAKRLRLIAWAYLSADRRLLANLRIEKVVWAEWKKD